MSCFRKVVLLYFMNESLEFSKIEEFKVRLMGKC